MAEALNIADPDLITHSAPSYSTFLLDTAHSDPELVLSVEKSLKHLVDTIQVLIMHNFVCTMMW